MRPAAAVIRCPRRPLLAALLVLLALFAVVPAGALGGVVPAERVAEFDARLNEIKQALESEQQPGSDVLRDYLHQLPTVREFANSCTSQNEARLEQLRTNLETLGESEPMEAVGVQQQRQALQRERRAVQNQLQLCRVLMLRANQLQDRITELQQAALTERLSRRGPPAWTVIGRNLEEPGRLWSTARLFLLRESGLDTLAWVEFIGLLGLALVCVGGSLYLRTPMFVLAGRHADRATLAGGFVCALLSCAANVLPALATSVGVAVFLTLVGVRAEGWAFITLLSYGLAGYFVFTFAVRVFLAPCPPARPYLPVPAGVLHSLARRLGTLALLVLIISLFSATLAVESFPGPVRDLLRLVVATILIINLARIIWLAGDLLRWQDTHPTRLLLAGGMLFALGAEWAGYRELSEYLVTGIVGTVLAFWGTWFVWRLAVELFDGLDEGRRGWQRALRRQLGVRPDQYMPGLVWLRALLALALWIGFVLLALLTWGLSDTGLAWLRRLLYEGLRLGEFELVPIELVWGILALIAGIVFTGWFKQRLDQRWLGRSRMERGAREAVVTVTGYVGVALAVLIGLAVAGVKFTNLAIIAGALSVGIGFGLQNIFNNFVSGLILLFERPIKTDDWIVVGNTEGYVKRISIRSTQIQTFDRSDVIVPNAELISGQVTNWMLRDPFGRVVVPVRVAYGTDPERVRDLLVRIARDHPRVITDALLAPLPEALLRRLGEYSMEFELRAFIRDIEWFLHVASDLNFAIEREFRDHGIEIPYPRQEIGFHRADAGGPRLESPRREGRGRASGETPGGGIGSPGDGGDA